MKTPLIIAEVGQAHDGSLGQAHAFIDAIAESGADVVKFQMHIASEESTTADKFRIPFSKQDKSRYDYWKRVEFTEEEWFGLADHAAKVGLSFVCSTFSLLAVERLKKIGVAAWKIGSGDLDFREMMEKILETNLPIWVSTGMAKILDIERVASYLANKNADFTLFQCTTMYPTPHFRY